MPPFLPLHHAGVGAVEAVLFFRDGNGRRGFGGGAFFQAVPAADDFHGVFEVQLVVFVGKPALEFAGDEAGGQSFSRRPDPPRGRHRIGHCESTGRGLYDCGNPALGQTSPRDFRS